MTDRGGSSGRLRDEFGHLPPGDVRQCLAALAPEDHASLLFHQLCGYRFAKGTGLDGHSFGNLFITALVEITGSTDKVRLRYESEGSYPVEADLDDCRRFVPQVVFQPLASDSVYLRHDPVRLAEAIMDVTGSFRALHQEFPRAD